MARAQLISGMWVKRCTKCGKDYSAADQVGLAAFFNRCYVLVGGLDGRCKVCENQRKMRKMREKGRHTAYSRRRRIRSPEKVLARVQVQVSIRRGVLTRGACFCGETRTEAHHHDYSKPLDVTWLCRKHHRELHQRERAEKEQG